MSIVFVVLSVRAITAQLWFLGVGLYTAVTYAVYLFRPELFSILKLDVEGDKTDLVGCFLLFSLLVNFFFYIWMSRSGFFFRLFVFRSDGVARIHGFVAVYVALCTSLWTYFITHQERFNWGDGEESLGSPLFALLFRIFIPLTILLVGLQASRPRAATIYNKVWTILGLMLIVSVAIKASSRSDIIYLMIGLMVFVTMHYEIPRFKLYGYLALSSVIALALGQVMLLQRASVDGSIFELLELVLGEVAILDEATITMLVSQDYFSPAASLILSVEKSLVFPSEVIKSNFFNALYLFDEDTLSALITTEYGLEFLRGAGLSFVIYTEGFNMFGIFGFIYSGMVSGFFLHIITPRFKGISEADRAILWAILSVLLLQIVRSQTGTAIKMLYTLAPVYLFYCTSLGYSVRIRLQRR